jgi:hypothetical protein
VEDALKIVKRLVGALALVGVALGLLYVVTAERVEVVVLHHHGADGEQRTRLWVTDDSGHAWLRTGAENASWLPRLRAQPEVELERGGATSRFRAVVVDEAETVGRINQRTLEKYGWSEQLLRATGLDPRRQVAIRLDPR